MEIDNTSAGGVAFQDSLTVSTFSATQGDAVISFQPSPSSMTVTGFLQVNGQDPSSRITLQSNVPGSSWKLKLAAGGKQGVSNASIEDSNASVGIAINANDNTSINLGNNTNWNFGSAGGNLYWVNANGTNLWSDPLNWSLTSGGSGGAGAPQLGNNAIFDGGSNANCNIDIPVVASTITISTAASGSYTGTINTNDNPITLGAATVTNIGTALLMNSGTFNAGASPIVDYGTLTQSSGTWNGNTSSMTVTSDTTLNGGVFNVGSSTITAYGNWTMNSPIVFNAGSGTLNLSGSGKTITPNTNPTFWNLNVPGTVTFAGSNAPSLSGLLNVSGTLTISDFGLNTLNGSTTTVSGTIGGSGVLSFVDSAVLGAGGTLNAPVWFRTSTLNVAVPARTFNGPVTLLQSTLSNFSGVLGAGTAVFNGGITINPSANGNLTLDASVHNPNVTITTITYSQGGTGLPILNAGAGTWNVSGLLTLSTGTFNADSANITFSSSVIMSTGTFNAGTSTITVQGDTTLNGGTFNANSSSLTLQGNFYPNYPLVSNFGTSTVNLTGSGKTVFNTAGIITVWNLNVPGSVTSSNQSLYLAGTANISGTFALTGGFIADSGSTITISGTISGGPQITSLPERDIGNGWNYKCPDSIQYVRRKHFDTGARLQRRRDSRQRYDQQLQRDSRSRQPELRRRANPQPSIFRQCNI